VIERKPEKNKPKEPSCDRGNSKLAKREGRRKRVLAIGKFHRALQEDWERADDLRSPKEKKTWVQRVTKRITLQKHDRRIRGKTRR